MDGRSAAANMLLRMENDGAFSNILAEKMLKEEGLSGRDRNFAAALFYGVTERRLTLDYIITGSSAIALEKLDKAVLVILRMGLYQLLYMNGVPESAAVNESVKLCRKMNVISAQGYINGMLRNFVRSGKKLDLGALDGADRLSVEYSCPKWLAERFIENYGMNRAARILKCSLGRAPMYARVNTIKTSADKLVRRLNSEGVRAKEHDSVRDCIVLEKTGNIEELSSFKEGLFHIQDLSSQICCLTLRPVVNETVIDICAAPGGKSFTMAELMGNNGLIYSLDLHEQRVGLISEGAKRLGIKIIAAKTNNALLYNDGLPLADKVLCDVPCSGFGVIRRKPEIKYKSDVDFEGLKEVQRRILEMSCRYVKAGGTLVYSTCTLNKEENDDIVEAFASRHTEFVPIVQQVPVPAESSYKRTYLPDEEGGDGFFTASFRRIR